MLFTVFIYILMCLVQPSLATPQIKLIDNPRVPWNNWRSHNASELRLEWAPYNLTMDINAKVNIKLWGYWEDTDDHRFEEVGTIIEQTENDGLYMFDPHTISRQEMVMETWRKVKKNIVNIYTNKLI